MRLRRSPLLLAPIALLAIVAAAHANEGSTSLGAAARDRSGRAIVERVAWETVDGKPRLVIAVRGVADYTARATGADPNGGLPDRAYVDLRPAVLGKEISHAPLMVDDGLARQVRVGQFDPQTVRVVVENPRAVQSAAMTATKQNSGRREMTGLQLSPGLIVS